MTVIIGIKCHSIHGSCVVVDYRWTWHCLERLLFQVGRGGGRVMEGFTTGHGWSWLYHSQGSGCVVMYQRSTKMTIVII